jgi:hypothetical protein
MAHASAVRTPCPLTAAVLLVLSGVAVAAEPAISFTRDIKGILSNRCVRCHGPDAEDRHGGGDDGLRLDTFAGATADLGGHAAIVPGKPAESELIARITSTDPDVVMPPPEAGERLTPREVELLTRWIAAGAEYEPHWAYVTSTASSSRGSRPRGLARSPRPTGPRSPADWPSTSRACRRRRRR